MQLNSLKNIFHSKKYCKGIGIDKGKLKPLRLTSCTDNLFHNTKLWPYLHDEFKFMKILSTFKLIS